MLYQLSYKGSRRRISTFFPRFKKKVAPPDTAFDTKEHPRRREGRRDTIAGTSSEDGVDVALDCVGVARRDADAAVDLSRIDILR
jgi:hypothetical protein